MEKRVQKDATKAGFDVNYINSFKGDFKAFKEWYDPRFKNLSAEKVWKDLEKKKAELEKKK